MKFVTQCALVGVLFASCAVPVDIVEGEDVLIVSPDASVSIGGTGTGGSGGTGGLSGAGGAVAQGGAGVSMGGTGFTQGGSGGAVVQGGGGGMAGSMMAMGGEAGMGMGGTGVEPPLDNCVETGSVGGFITEVLYTENVQAQSIDVTLAVRNTGAAFNMNQLSVRYWFTPGTTQPFTFACYYAQSATGATITDDVNVTFGQNAVSAFAEVTVDRAEPMGTGINQIQLSMRANNVALVHDDDFSYVPDVTAFQLNPNISAYVDGVRVYGCEPPNP